MSKEPVCSLINTAAMDMVSAGPAKRVLGLE